MKTFIILLPTSAFDREC